MKGQCPHCGAELFIETHVFAQRRKRQFDHDAAYALLKMGATQAEVARAFKVTRQAIHSLEKRRDRE